MKKRIVNEYAYDINTFKSRLNITFNKYSLKAKVILYILLIDMLIMYIFDQKAILLLYMLGIIILLLGIRLLNYIIIRNSAKKAQRVINDLHVKYVIEKDYLIINNIKKIPLTNLKSVSQNKEWIIINFQKIPFIMLKKDSFTSSTDIECYKYLKSFIRNNKIKQK